MDSYPSNISEYMICVDPLQIGGNGLNGKDKPRQRFKEKILTGKIGVNDDV
jgi:hypothetical protein